MKKGIRLSEDQEVDKTRPRVEIRACERIIAKWSISNHQLAIKVPANFALLILQFALVFWWQSDILISRYPTG